VIPGTIYRCTSSYVFDGDTLNLDIQGAVFKVRLQWVDAPESKKNNQNSADPRILEHWEMAENATIALKNLVRGKALIAIPSGKDYFDRWLCDCYIGTISAVNNVQTLLCKLGMVLSFLPFNRYAYTSRELAIIRGIITETANANRKKVGIWSKPDFILPSDFKKLTIL